MTIGLNNKIAALAAEYAAAGVRYQHRGTSRRGCDCTGLIVGILQELGYLRGFVLRPYPPDWNLHAAAGNQVVEEIEAIADRVNKKEAIAGDIAVIFWGRCPAHAGVVVHGPTRPMMVHAYSSAGKCQYAMLVKSPWAKRWHRAYRLSEDKLANV
jgi:cell wall-associated NlpC family hydrolase